MVTGIATPLMAITNQGIYVVNAMYALDVDPIRIALWNARCVMDAERMEQRKHGVGGSEIAAVAGIHPWMSPLDVWLRKTGHHEPDLTDNYHVQRGRFLGPAIIEWYQDKTGIDVGSYGDDEMTIVHPEHPIIFATPDGIAVDRVIEVKSPSAGNGWGLSYSDEVPTYIVPQVVWQMAVTGLRKADVVALIYGDIRIYHLEWSQAVFDALLGRAERFWANVESATPPLDQGLSEDALRRLYSRSNGVMLDSTPEIDTMAQKLIAATILRKEAEHAEKHLRTEIIAAIGEHDGVRGDWGSITYKSSRPQHRVDWNGIAKEHVIPRDVLDRHTTEVEGSRRFMLKTIHE